MGFVDQPPRHSGMTCTSEASATVAMDPGPAPTPLALRDTAPLALAVIPFALAIGATIAESGISAGPSLAGSVLLMAGASQLAVIGVLAGGGGVIVAISTALMINMRFVLYSSGLAKWFEGEPRWVRLLLALPLIDQTFLLGQRRFSAETSGRWRRRYYVTASGLMVVCFVSFQLAGYKLGAVLPSGAGLQLAAPLAFAGMLGMASRGRANVTAATTAAVTVVLVAGLPAGLALPAAIGAGLAVGSVALDDEDDE